MALIAVAAAEGKTLPPGFRFHPTDEEIVGHYLRNKVLGRKPDIEVIREIDLYKCEPWDLPEKSILPTRDPEWYFFCARDKKYPNGSRSNRATEKGYWKATGKDRKVNSQSNKIGMKKTLVFYKGRAPHGERTDWLMHEYRLDEVLCKGSTQLQDLYVICRVFRKGRLASKDGEQYGIPRDEIDFSLSKSTSSPSKVNSVGEIEEQSDERSLREIQDDDSPTTPGLPSETSSEILDSKAEDNVCLDGSVESSRGKSNLDCGVVSLDMTVLDKNAEDEVGNQGLLSIPSFNFDEVDNQGLHLPQLPDFSFADDVIFGHMQMSEEDNLQYFFGYSIEDILAGEFSNQDNVLQSIEDPNNNEICAADGNDGIPFNDVNVQFRPRPSTWQSHHQPLPSQGTAPRRIRLQCKDYDSEVVSEQEDSGLTSPSQTCSLEEDDVGSDIFSTGESSLGSEKSVNTTGLEEKSTLTEISDSMSSSEFIESSCAQLGPLIANVLQDNNENLQQQFNNSDDSGEVIPVTREQAMLRKSKHVEKSDVTTSMSNVFERDMVLVKEGMESPATMNSNRSSRASDEATGFDSMQVKASGSQGVITHKTVIKCKESVKRTGFRFILCGLKQRGKSSAKDTVFVCEKESTDVIKRPSYYSKECGTGFVNLGKGGTGFVNLGKASSIFLVTGLLVTAVLVCFTWSYGS